MTKPVQLGKKIPPFKIQNQDEHIRSSEDYLGKWLVLYFYPKDNTPGCTKEAIAFTELKQKFTSHQATIVGISPDSPASHQRFIEKQSLQIELLSDTQKELSEKFGVWQLKKMAGREYMGVVRTTFLIDPDGVVQQIWEKVKVKGHAEMVLDQLCTL